MLRSAAADDEFVSGIVPSQTVLWTGAETAPAALRELLAECGYSLHGRDLDDWPARRVAWLAPAPVQARDKCDLSQRRLAVVHPDPGSADALAEALRARGAQVVVLSVGETGLERAEALDPDAVIVQPERFWPAGRTVINALWQHPWLRWTPVLFVPAERLGSASASAPDVRELTLGLRTLCATYDLCARRAARKERFELQLSQLGPVRTLRALLESRCSLRLRLEAPERVYEIDLGEGLVIGGRVSVQREGDWEELLGVHAVKSLLARMDGRVHVTPVERPALANIMAPLEAVLLSGHEEQASAAAQRSDAGLSALRRVQATLHGMPAPLLQARASQAARAGGGPTSELAELRRARSEQPADACDDASPTRAFPASLRPAPAPTGDPEPSVPPLQVLQGRGHAFVRAYWRKLALVAALLMASALLAWPAAQRAPRPPPPLPVPGEASVSSPVHSQPAPLADPQAASPVDAIEVAPVPAVPEPSEARALAARANTLVLKGHRLRKVGRLRAARVAYHAALEAQPGMPRALAGLVELRLLQRDPAQALEIVQELLKHRHTPDDLRLFGDVLLLSGRREEALAVYRGAAARGNASARARLKKHAP
jgi:tetratricopeptide (TPR) repeat protein/CheY-like chemotaxis protein